MIFISYVIAFIITKNVKNFFFDWRILFRFANYVIWDLNLISFAFGFDDELSRNKIFMLQIINISTLKMMWTLDGEYWKNFIIKMSIKKWFHSKR